MVQVHNRILLDNKKDKVMYFAATWWKLENITMSEVSPRERDRQ